GLFLADLAKGHDAKRAGAHPKRIERAGDHAVHFETARDSSGAPRAVRLLGFDQKLDAAIDGPLDLLIALLVSHCHRLSRRCGGDRSGRSAPALTPDHQQQNGQPIFHFPAFARISSPSVRPSFTSTFSPSDFPSTTARSSVLPFFLIDTFPP